MVIFFPRSQEQLLINFVIGIVVVVVVVENVVLDFRELGTREMSGIVLWFLDGFRH